VLAHCAAVGHSALTGHLLWKWKEDLERPALAYLGKEDLERGCT